MRKPHEQEWTLDRHMVVNEDGKGICRMQGSASSVEAEALILAAPAMARALLEVRTALAYGALDRDGATEVIERALRKAGVLPESTGG